MKMISIVDVTKTYGEKELFRKLNFTIGEKERVGLIGINGTGKSSLLKIVAGIEEQDEGEITFAKDYTIGFLSQQPDMDPEKNVLDQVFSGDTPIVKLMRDYERVSSDLSHNPENTKIQEQFYEIQQRMDRLEGWDANTAAKSILMKLGITDYTWKVGNLSGGQKKRVALARVLIESPDLLILDEPTNHLDYDTVKWLEEFLSKYQGSLLLVTHDRYFLDRVTNRIFELDGGNLYSYKGNYASFLEAKAIREENEAATLEKKKNLFRNELEWIRRGAKARTTKQKARIQRFDKLESEINTGKSTENLDISLGGSRLGKQVLELKNAQKHFGSKQIIDSFDILIKPGDRLGIIGRNGTGKSTLLNILAGKSNLDSGELIIGQTVKIAYYTQEYDDLDENKRMIEYLKETAEVVHTTDGKVISAAQMLERFLFPTYSHGTPIRKLSGGEKRRLYLLKLLMEEPNVLLLDEPTNDLDTQTLTVLEDYLDDFPGVVITVSHDRYFLDKVVDQILVLEGNGKTDLFYGNYTEYLEKRQTVIENTPSEKKEKKEPELKPKKKRMTFKEKKEWEEIDHNIEATEEKLQAIHEQLGGVGSDFEKAQMLMKEETKLNEQLEYLIERWSYLAEIAENE